MYGGWATPRVDGARCERIGLPDSYFPDPCLNRLPQLAQAAFEKMVRAFDHHQLFRLRQRGRQAIQLLARAELIPRTADQQFRLVARAQKVKFVSPLIRGHDRNPQSDCSLHPIICTRSAQSHRRSERKSRKNQRQGEFRLQPIQRGTDVITLSVSIVVGALAQAGPTEIEAQHGESKGVQSLHGVKHDLVVQSPAVKRMRVADQRGVRGILRAAVEQSLQSPRRPFQKERLDGRILCQHATQLTRSGLQRDGDLISRYFVTLVITNDLMLICPLPGFANVGLMYEEPPPSRRITPAQLEALRRNCPHLSIDEYGHCENCHDYFGNPVSSRQGFSSCILSPMDVVALTRRLIDIESISGNEGPVGDFLHRELSRLGYAAKKMPVEGTRANVYATRPKQPRPEIIFSTHMDTVPPFISSSEDADRVYGRGSCDAKGIIAVQVAAAEKLRSEGIYVGLLFLVGEERDSLGAKVANEHPLGSRFLVNGEPTENKMAVASKGTLRVEILAEGRMAHSAYPELGESAIDKLVEAVSLLRAMKLPATEGIGPCTLNIGVIEGGRAPNVIPDHARAQLLYRLVGPAEDLRRQIVETVGNLARVEFVLEIPFLRLRTLDGLPTMVAAFTTDIPALSNWGEPLLVGPGSIHVAHTTGEYVEKKQLGEAVDLYCAIARRLTA